MVAENLRAAARRRRMSLNKLADFAGVNRPHLLRVVAGKAEATVGWLAGVAGALQLDLRDLFDPAVLSDEPTPRVRRTGAPSAGQGKGPARKRARTS